jgi:S1-C subfamily serine protease
MWLTIRTGAERGKTVRVEGERFVLGRDDDCDLTIDDAKVSRRHLVLERLPDGSTSLQDLGSSNGTFVDGKRVESAPLNGNTQIQVGNTVLFAAAEQPAPARAPTVFGSTVLGALLSPESPSAVYRLVVQRSIRRATVLGATAILIAVGVAALFATHVLPPGGGGASAVERVVRTAARSTVPVVSLDRGAPVESGTGWVLDGKQSLIVTNAHVINGGTEFQVSLGGTAHPANVVGVAPCEDLAVLHVTGASGLQPLALGSQSSLNQGETVVAVGYPANASQEATLTSTTGVVSVVRSRFDEQTLDAPRYPNVIQTDAAINPGNSGGPLLDLDGRLVGVTSAGRTISPDGRVVQGQSYAIGVDRVKEIAGVLRRHRSIGWTGASFEYAAPAELKRRGLPPGLLTGPAVPGTPADKAGLRAGLLVLAVNGLQVSSLATYCDAVAGIGSGEQVAFTVLQPGATTPRVIRVALP